MTKLPLDCAGEFSTAPGAGGGLGRLSTATRNCFAMFLAPCGIDRARAEITFEGGKFSPFPARWGFPPRFRHGIYGCHDAGPDMQWKSTDRALPVDVQSRAKLADAVEIMFYKNGGIPGVPSTPASQVTFKKIAGSG